MKDMPAILKQKGLLLDVKISKQSAGFLVASF
jgi:hypothetical protein